MVSKITFIDAKPAQPTTWNDKMSRQATQWKDKAVKILSHPNTPYYVGMAATALVLSGIAYALLSSSSNPTQPNGDKVLNPGGDLSSKN